jgi:hypothetical protein
MNKLTTYMLFWDAQLSLWLINVLRRALGLQIGLQVASDGAVELLELRKLS